MTVSPRIFSCSGTMKEFETKIYNLLLRTVSWILLDVFHFVLLGSNLPYNSQVRPLLAYSSG